MHERPNSIASNLHQLYQRPSQGLLLLPFFIYLNTEQKTVKQNPIRQRRISAAASPCTS
ncbi:hypothetical protein HN51_054456, partial [Arachis hypogaea]